MTVISWWRIGTSGVMLLQKNPMGELLFTTYYSCTLLDSSAEMQQLMAGVADIADAKRLASDGFNISEKLEASDCRSSIRWSGLFIL